MEDETEYLDHIGKQLDIDIKNLDDKKKKLSKLKSDLFSYQLSKREFRCPIGKNNIDAICPQCNKVLPRIQELLVRDKGEVQIKIYPIGMKDELKEMCNKNTEGCIEWRKKNIAVACGCAGTASCICGYSENFCYPNLEVCPFCGRGLKIEYSIMYNKMANNFNFDKELFWS